VNDFTAKLFEYANLDIMSQQDLEAGDFLVFQLESGFALLRLLAIDDIDGNKIWHVAAYRDFFPDVDNAEAATVAPEHLTISTLHLALTDRAFVSTQVARIANVRLTEQELKPLNEWRDDPERELSDRSVRLLLGLR